MRDTAWYQGRYLLLSRLPSYGKTSVITLKVWCDINYLMVMMVTYLRDIGISMYLYAMQGKLGYT